MSVDRKFFYDDELEVDADTDADADADVDVDAADEEMTEGDDTEMGDA
jgi:hypothetical protein